MSIEKRQCEGGDFHTTTDFLDWVADAEGYAESIAYTHPDNASLIASAPRLQEDNARLKGQVKLLREALDKCLLDLVGNHIIDEVLREEQGKMPFPEPDGIAIARAALEATKEGA